MLLGAAALLAGEPARFGWAVAVAALVALVLDIAYRLWPDKMGFGDVRLTAAVVAWRRWVQGPGL